MPHSTKDATTPQALVPDEDRSGTNAAAFAAEAYNAVARAAKLRRIALLRSNFQVELEYFSSFKKEDAPKARYGGDFGKPYFDPEAGRATCEWTWRMYVREKRKKTLSIEVVYFLFYYGLENCVEEQVFRYLRRVGRFASYPYFRAHVSQLNWEAGTDLAILPTIAT